MKINASKVGTRFALYCGTVLLVVCCTMTAWADNPGSVFTTDGSGNQVNGNIYTSFTSVYLNGGPNNSGCNGSKLPDGWYYFQVTDPSGSILLSSDTIQHRQVHVANGIFENTAIDHPSTAQTGICGSYGVQLAPFAANPNQDEYKVWVTLESNYNLGSCASNFGFCDNHSKTDNFHIHIPPTCTENCGPITWPIAGVKFYDQNASGILQSTGSFTLDNYTITNPIPHFKFKLVSACAGKLAAGILSDLSGCLVFPDTSGAPRTTSTDGEGKFRFDGLNAGNTYGVCEVFPTATTGTQWQATAACPNSETGAYSIGNGLWGEPYPTTYDGPTNHLGFGDSICNNPTSSNPQAAFYTNISDVYEWGAPGANFGNRCSFIAGGGLTKGFWSNSNGNRLITNAGGLSFIASLKDAGTDSTPPQPLNFIGSDGNPVVFSQLSCSGANTSSKFDCWLTNASNSSNPANQLSAQMVAADLNVVLGLNAVAGGCGKTFTGSCEPKAASYTEAAWGGGSQCGADGGNNGWTTIGCLINEANAALAAWPNPATVTGGNCTVTFGSGSLGSVNCVSYETNLQNLLNLVNNNDTSHQPVDATTGTALCGTNYVGSESCSVTVPLAPPSVTFPLVNPIQF